MAVDASPYPPRRYPMYQPCNHRRRSPAQPQMALVYQHQDLFCINLMIDIPYLLLCSAIKLAVDDHEEDNRGKED